MLEDRGHVEGVGLVDGVPRWLAQQERITELEEEVAQLREALVHRQRYGVVTGVLAVRFRISPERAWQILVRLSQQSNLKVQVIARIIHDRSFGRLAPEDRAVATRLDAHLQGPLAVLTSAIVEEAARGDR